VSPVVERPDVGSPVLGDAEDSPAIRGEGRGLHGGGMGERREEPAIRNVPDAGDPILASRHEPRAAGIELRRGHPGLMRKACQLDPGAHLPEGNHSVITDGGQPAAAGAGIDRENALPGRHAQRQQLPRLHVPHVQPQLLPGDRIEAPPTAGLGPVERLKRSDHVPTIATERYPPMLGRTGPGRPGPEEAGVRA
jgi:hypothetical protein